MKITVNNAGALQVIKVASGAQGPQGPIGALNADDRAYVDAAKASVATSEASATDSAATATAAETSATASAVASLASETAAATSQGAAAGSATAAAASANQIASSYAAFQKLFLGDLPSDPSTDNQGNPLVEGATYFNTSLVPQRTRTFTGGVWVDTNKDAETANVSAQLSASAASGSASAALSSQNAAAASKVATDADVVTTGTNKAAAAASAALAANWSAQASGTIDGTNFSAKFYSLAAATSAGQASDSAAAAAASAAAANLFDPANYVSKTAGGTFLANIGISDGSAHLSLNNTLAGQQAGLSFLSQGMQLWQWVMDGQSQTGGNAGQSMQLAAYSDAGVYMFGACSFDRATGKLHLIAVPAVNGVDVWTQQTLPVLVDPASGNMTTGPTAKFSSAFWPNTTFNGTAEFGDAGWTSKNFAAVVGSFGEGTMFQNTTALSGVTVDNSEMYVCNPGVTISLSATTYTPGLTGAAAAAVVDVQFLDASGAPIDSPGPSIVAGTGEDWQRRTSSAQTSPTGTAFARTRKYIAGTGCAASAFGVVFKDIKTERFAGSSSQSQEESIRSLFAPLSQCYLSVSGANLLLAPRQGFVLTIAGRNRRLQSAGVTLAPTGTVVNTLYYIYAAWSETTQAIALEYSTTVWAIDSQTCLKVKTGDTTRTYVGMAYCFISGAWTDTSSVLGVLSEFNRRGKTITGRNAGGTTTTVTTYVPLNLICHADENVRLDGKFTGFTNTVNTSMESFVTLDGVQKGDIQTQSFTNPSFFGCVNPSWEGLATEGHHAASLWAGPNSGAPTINGTATLFATTRG